MLVLLCSDRYVFVLYFFKILFKNSYSICKIFILSLQASTHPAEVLSNNKSLSPFILALGTPANLEFSKFYVIFYKTCIPCGDSFLKALDVCFKFFTVFYYPLPLESYNLWYFIIHGVTGKPSLTSMMPPVVQALLGQIMPKI